ncbi:hypothetical protein COB80_01250 [Candidatus Kaiserbacteria bacterium]|nr:MAG: hypothetical protein COB80_01250 [Candidatus Kaiserbacteria bacterium]
MIDLVGQNTMMFTVLVALWTLPWKGWALWLAARRGEKWWFIALLVLNTLAILDIIYIFVVAKRSSTKMVTSTEGEL